MQTHISTAVLHTPVVLCSSQPPLKPEKTLGDLRPYSTCTQYDTPENHNLTQPQMDALCIDMCVPPCINMQGQSRCCNCCRRLSSNF
jgi:hypothetical protein